MSNQPRRVLIVDDDVEIRTLVAHILQSAGYQVTPAPTCADALRVARTGFVGVVVLDLRLPDGNGRDLLPKMAKIAPDNPVIILTGHSTTDLALDSIREGAFEFLAKEQIGDRLLATVRDAFASAERFEEASTDPSSVFAGIVTRSPAMRAVLRSLAPVLESRVPVLIRGESGTGKELVARALHFGGPRRDGPFVGFNCAGVPANLLESELYGYERGAFTGAAGRKLGRFDLAQRGTLLLDEIGEMQPLLQAKLLRVLQEREYERVGGVKTLKADVRVLSATNRDLESEVEEGRFREDLYYRLAVFTVELPPLRDRHGDVPLLTGHFVRKAAAREGKALDGVDDMAMELLSSYSFPGNVRQLENVIAHAAVAARGRTIRIADLPGVFLNAVALERSAAGGTDDDALAEAPTVPDGDAPFPTLRELEGRHIRAALERANGNKALAARLLGTSRMTLYRKLAEHEIVGVDKD